MNDFCCGCGILLPIGNVNNETMCKVCKREASLRQLNNKSQTCDCEYCERSDNYKLLPSKETKFFSQPEHLQFSPTQNHNELDFRISQIHFVDKNESFICGGNEFTTCNQVVQEQSSDILIGLNSNEQEENKAVDSFISEEIKQQWESKQLFYKEQLIQKDTSAIAALISGHRRKADGSRYYVGGVDISFIVGNSVDACACLCVVRMPDLEVVYQKMEMIQLTQPYIPGFLAFREVPALLKLLEDLKAIAPHYFPDVILLDGNGILHPRGFGLACQLGVLAQVPTVGIAKTLISAQGIVDDQNHKNKKAELKEAGDGFELISDTGETLGMCLRAHDKAQNPIYVSVGHMISLRSSVWLALECSKYRIPEPVRRADIDSREYLRQGKTEPYEFIAPVEN